MAGRYAPDTTSGPADPWWHRAACTGMDTALWFPKHGEGNAYHPGVIRAKAVCGGCPVARACLVAALREERGRDIVCGIRGGLTGRERVEWRKQWLAASPSERARLVREWRQQKQRGAA